MQVVSSIKLKWVWQNKHTSVDYIINTWIVVYNTYYIAVIFKKVLISGCESTAIYVYLYYNILEVW